MTTLQVCVLAFLSLWVLFWTPTVWGMFVLMGHDRKRLDAVEKAVREVAAIINSDATLDDMAKRMTIVAAHLTKLAPVVLCVWLGACGLDPVPLPFGGGTGGAGGAGGGLSQSGGAVGTGGAEIGGASGAAGAIGTGGAVGTGGAAPACVALPVPAVDCAVPSPRFQGCQAKDAGGNVVAICFDEHDVRSIEGCWAQGSNRLHCVLKCPCRGGV